MGDSSAQPGATATRSPASRQPFEQAHALASRVTGDRRVQNLLLPLALAAISILELLHQHLLQPRGAVLCAALCLPLYGRRERPLPTLAGLAAVAFVQWLISVPQLADAALLLVLYEVALSGTRAEVAASTAVVELGAILAAVRWGPVDPVKTWVGLSALVGMSSALGITVRQRRALLESLRERNLRLELERDQELRLAAEAERARIAREMHDIIAHNLSVMIALADGAGYAIGTSPEQASEAVERISAAGRQALGEMRRLLGLLDDEQAPFAAAPLAPQPDLGGLEELFEQVGTAGVIVRAELDPRARQLDPGMQLMVFRVVQEALTNVLKHGGGPAEAEVTLSLRRELLELEVQNRPRGRAQRAAQPPSGEVLAAAPGLPPPPTAAGDRAGGGHGLHGIRERAAAYDGVFSAGPAAEGGWCVRLQIPLAAPLRSSAEPARVVAR